MTLNLEKVALVSKGLIAIKREGSKIEEIIKILNAAFPNDGSTPKNDSGYYLQSEIFSGYWQLYTNLPKGVEAYTSGEFFIPTLPFENGQHVRIINDSERFDKAIEWQFVGINPINHTQGIVIAFTVHREGFKGTSTRIVALDRIESRESIELTIEEAAERIGVKKLTIKPS